MVSKTDVCLYIILALVKEVLISLCELGLGVESLTLYSKKSHAKKKKMPLLHQTNFIPVTHLKWMLLTDTSEDWHLAIKSTSVINWFSNVSGSKSGIRIVKLKPLSACENKFGVCTYTYEATSETKQWLIMNHSTMTRADQTDNTRHAVMQCIKQNTRKLN